MKKNLRNILAVALGLMTTVAFAQTWNADSRTRIDMSGDHDKMSTSQRATIGATCRKIVCTILFNRLFRK